MIATILCFGSGTVSARMALAWLRNGLPFVPRTIRLDQLRFKNLESLHTQLLHAGESEVDRLTVTAGELHESPSFGVANLLSWGLHLVHWRQPEEYPTDELVDEISALQGFHSAYKCDWELLLEQSRDYEEMLDLNDMPTPEQQSKYPARQSRFFGMNLVAAYKMWFGPWAQQHISRESLCNFEPIESRRLLSSGTVHLQLYKDVGSRGSHVAERLALFRTICGLNKLEIQRV